MNPWKAKNKFFLILVIAYIVIHLQDIFTFDSLLGARFHGILLFYIPAFTVTKSGKFLLVQQEKTSCCLPRDTEFPHGFNACFAENHMSSEEESLSYWKMSVFRSLHQKSRA